jgi:hypothetical protein
MRTNLAAVANVSGALPETEEPAVVSVDEADVSAVLDQIDEEVSAVVGEGQSAVSTADDYFALLEEGVRVRFPHPHLKGAELGFSVWIRATLAAQDNARKLLVGYRKKHRIKEDASVPATVFANIMARAWWDGGCVLKWDFPAEFSKANFIAVIQKSPKLFAVLVKVFGRLTMEDEQEGEEERGNS